MNRINFNSKRIEATFKKEKPALITYIMGGDPANQGTVDMMLTLASSGADIIELGMPFSDPVADGFTIQQAGIRALNNGATLAKTINAVKEFRKVNDRTPIVLMGYYNPIMQYGEEKFAKEIAKYKVDGVIVVDLPLEENKKFAEMLAKLGIDFIQLIAPTSFDRLNMIAKAASGFVYYISVLGITGTKSAEINTLKKASKTIKEAIKIPVVAGFGIKSAKDLKPFIDAGFSGAVVGSSLIDAIFKQHKRGLSSKKAAASFVKLLNKYKI